MATTYNQGVLKSSDITASTSSTADGQAPDRRRLYDFGDRVAELRPEESPFFVYLSKVGKVPTSDNQFRFLENRSKIDWTSRSFYISTGGASAPGTVTENTNHTFSVDNGSGSSIDWLVKGMVFTVNTLTSAAAQEYSQVVVRVESAPVVGSSDTTFTGRVISLSKGTDSGGSAISGYDSIDDDDVCQVVGTSFAEGTGAPDVWSSEIEDDFGYTQIFKTACEMSNTAIAIKYRGYGNEWQRLWAEKLREHKVDIERALLFGQRANSNGIYYTEGLVGHILKNAAVVNADAALSYTSGTAYFRSADDSEMTYDRLLSDFEVLFDPARGGESDKLALASLPVVTWFNKLGDGAFLDISVGSAANMPFRMDMSEEAGAFGHKLLKIETINGTLHMVKEPLFRGNASSLLLIADLSNLSYRPLVGNGLNRDTHIISNVQAADEDLRKDMILTEAGLEISLPETHMLYSIEDL